MKRILILLMLIAVATAAPMPQAAAQATTWQQVPIPPLPAFNAEKIDIAQKEENDGISRRNDQVGEIAHRESVKLAYGPENPYARVPEYSTVAAITRQDLIDWHGKYVHPNNIILGISGDFNSAAMESRLRAAFEAWPKGPAFPKHKIQYNPAKPGY